MNIIIILIIIIIIFFILLLLISRRRNKHYFGLAEGTETTLELKNNPQMRETYSNFKEIMFETLSAKYDNIKVIASGGMGIIVSANEKKSGRKVAIKTISPKLHKNPKAIKYFFQECQAIQKMNHPNIIRIYDTQDEGFLWYVMEFLDGETLDEYMNKTGVLDIASIVRIGTQVARALQHCHSNGIVHRDIKPSNIYMTQKNQTCKIIDFGVVKMLNSEVPETGAIGSPHYASPEQIQGGKITGKSDIYALGVCLYKMASGQFPYTNIDLNTKVFGKARNIRELKPDLPDELVNIINDCIALSPDDRC
ncbi:MAG: Serine/threonine protein kinase, partial [uncultured bacterium]